MPAIAQCQRHRCLLNGRHRWQARLPQVFSAPINLRQCAKPVGVSLLAIAVCQSTAMLRLMALSRAGSLLHLLWATFKHRDPCGSWLASDSGVSATSMVAGRTPSLASQLPQVAALIWKGMHEAVFMTLLFQSALWLCNAGAQSVRQLQLKYQNVETVRYRQLAPLERCYYRGSACSPCSICFPPSPC
ncbi:hypothetical protein PHLH6_00400 [Pseudomonas sp. Seg1]|nr:hypothetical protein PHLH6_00400 [Pseudomonas sp. Seg1]